MQEIAGKYNYMTLKNGLEKKIKILLHTVLCSKPLKSNYVQSYNNMRSNPYF